MFGFLRPSFRDVHYRQAYARCCSMQHLQFGVSSLPFLSYESVLLYLLTVETGLNPGPSPSTPTCCRLRTSAKLRNDPDSHFARVSAAFGVLLGLIKLDDDVRDDGRLISRFAHWLLARRQSSVEAVFTDIDQLFTDRVAELIDDHLTLESNWSRHPVTLFEYAEPTAQSFGYLFSLAANNTEQQPLFAQIGESIGRAILTFDCAADFHQDRAKGRFNPLADESEIETALDLACAGLDQAAWLCEQQSGPTSLCARVLTSVFDRTAKYSPRPTGRCAIRPAWKQRLANWGLHKEPGYVYARIDCCEVVSCCDGIGELGGCCSSAGEGAACCGEGSSCGCDVCFACDCCCDEGSGKSKAELEKLLGETGVSRSALSPNGVVLINGQRHRARAEDGTIPANAQVQVVDVVRSTLVVRMSAGAETQ